MRLVCVVLLLLGMPGAAWALDDPDTEVARRHFEKGRTFYDGKDYRHALEEFLAARRAKAAAGLDYNIARCYDRLEEYEAAIKHYQLYLDAKPGAPDMDEIRERIGTLKKRLDEQKSGVEPVARPKEPETPLLLPSTFDSAPVVVQKDDSRARRRRNGAIAGGVIAGAVVIGGAIVLGILLSQPSVAGLSKSDLGPFTVTR